jgi:hypothetical protein
VLSGQSNQNLSVINHGDRRQISYNPEITLAMYRELASHLEQVDGVSVELIWQGDREFSYLGSQIAALELTFANALPQHQNLVEDILNHYGNWQ